MTLDIVTGGRRTNGSPTKPAQIFQHPPDEIGGDLHYQPDQDFLQNVFHHPLLSPCPTVWWHEDQRTRHWRALRCTNMHRNSCRLLWRDFRAIRPGRKCWSPDRPRRREHTAAPAATVASGVRRAGRSLPSWRGAGWRSCGSGSPAPRPSARRAHRHPAAP